jgi:hypothetical protein
MVGRSLPLVSSHVVVALCLWSPPLYAQEAEPAPAATELDGEEVSAERQEQAPTPGLANCYGRRQRTWGVRDFFVGLTNPLAVENKLQVGHCWPLLTDAGLLYDLSHVETGLVHYLSPSYTHQGLYVSFAPLSLVVFRLEVMGIYIWPLPMAGTSYLPRDSLWSTFSSSGLTHHVDHDYRSAGGLNANLSVTLQGSVTLAEWRRGPIELIFFDTLTLDYWFVGTESYYYNVQRDAILARSDWLVSNFATILVDIPLNGNHSIRTGPVDKLLYQVGAERIEHHQVGLLAAFHIKDAGRRVQGLQPFLQVSYYLTHHGRRLTVPINVIAGIEFQAPFF